MKRSSFLLVLVILVAGFAAACSGDNTERPAPGTETPAEATSPVDGPPASTGSGLPAAEPIDWSDCNEGGYDCAEYDVPLDYEQADGDTVTLAVRRLSATDPSQRTGVLFANPGGPGGSAIDSLSGWARSLDPELRARFDIVLFDPRAVGHSSPLVCHGNLQELMGLDPYPETDADWQANEDAARRQAQECSAAGPDVLPHLGTINVARDMDRLREAMDEEQITYLGYSYGTSIGQVYADLFPENVRAMVLDGAIDVSLAAEEQTTEQILGFEAAFQRYLEDCAVRSCIGGDPEAVVRDLLARASQEPIPASGGDRAVGAGEASYAILGSLYSQASWPGLTDALNAALDGDGSLLLSLADDFAGRRADGTYSNQMETNLAVNCLDSETNRDPEFHREIASEFAEDAPFFGPSAGQFGLSCAVWEAEPVPLAAPRAAGAPPILVVGTTGDPATPFKWAVSLAEQLESGVLLTYDGEGHVAYLGRDACIEEAVDAYLLEVQPPAEGTVCGDAGIEPQPPAP